MIDHEIESSLSYTNVNLEDCPPGWQPRSAPDDWTPPDKTFGEPDFKDVDNPGKWSEFTYRPKYKGKVLAVPVHG